MSEKLPDASQPPNAEKDKKTPETNTGDDLDTEFSQEEEDDNVWVRQEVLAEAQEDIDEAKEAVREAQEAADRAHAESMAFELYLGHSGELGETADETKETADTKKTEESKSLWGKTWDVIGFPVAKAADAFIWTGTKIGKMSSDVFTGIEKWGKGAIEKNLPWIKKIPFLGKWLTGDVLPSWREQEEKASKDKKDGEKKKKQDKEKEKKAAEKKEKDAKSALEKSQKAAEKQVQAEEKKAEQKQKEHIRELLLYGDDYEMFQYKHGDEETRKKIIDGIEANMDVRKEKRKNDELDRLVVNAMTPEEKRQYQEQIADDDADKTTKEQAKIDLLERVKQEIETPARRALLEKNKKSGGGKQKAFGQQKGGGKGKRSS